MKKEFTKGETAFNITGCEVEVVGMLDGKYLVYHVYEQFWGDESEYRADTSVIHSYDALYSSPPVEVQCAEIKKLEDKICEKKTELRDLEISILTTKKDHSSLIANLKKTTALQYIDDIIDNRITHIVEERYGEVYIHEFDEFIKTRHRYDKGFRLLSLYGSSNGDLQFKINEYTDGSGTDTNVFLFPNKEAAMVKAQSIVATIVAGLEQKIVSTGNAYVTKSIISGFLSFGVESKIINEYFANKTRNDIESTIATLTAKIQEQQTLLGAL